MRHLILLLCAAAFFGCSIREKRHVELVNPMIGTGGHGHTFPGATTPFGMVQLSPDTRADDSWDGCSGYHHSDSVIFGFSHTHLSGTGCSDWGDILVMPTTHAVSMNNKQYCSAFRHENEKASPGYYKVLLDKEKIECELTVTPRTGIHRYTFPKGTEQQVLIDLLHRDKTLECELNMLDSVTITGYRNSEAWARQQPIYFAMRFSRPIQRMLRANSHNLVKHCAKGQRTEGAAVLFGSSDEPLMIKVGISSVDAEGALKNLASEAPHWSFQQYRDSAEAAWEKYLSVIDVKGGDEDKKTVFYTALYHSGIHPSLNMDIDNRYRGRDGHVHLAQGFSNYSVFSLWDTYRAAHPLYTLIQPQKVSDFINSFLVQYEQAGRLPVWELSSYETDCMIGFHSVSVIADAMAKGIRGFDGHKALEAAVAASDFTYRGIPLFNQNGLLQVDDESESVSKTLEYGYDNWCVGKIAQHLGDTALAKKYWVRSSAYKNMYDPSTGCMRPRRNGGWLTPFKPGEINNHFTEGNSWQYSFCVQHDIEGLIRLHGGKENFAKKLDELFNTSEKTSGREQADVTGLIGQYAHGNEPSHHMAYLYPYAGHPEKTKQLVDKICSEFYLNREDGLIGNEDCGQMSSWYVFSSLGFYPVCPGTDEYVIGSPQFEEAVIHMKGGDVKITAKGDHQHRLARCSVNDGKDCLYFTHAELAKGGKIEIEFGGDEKDRSGLILPHSSVAGTGWKTAPTIVAPARAFYDSMRIEIKGMNPLVSIDGSEFRTYIKPFSITRNSSIVTKEQGIDAAQVSGSFYRIPMKVDVTVQSTLNPQYMAEGPQSLVDGIHGSTQWRKGDWLGCQGEDFECTVDLKKETTITRGTINCLQDCRSWIVMPKDVEMFVSADGKKFVSAGMTKAKMPVTDLEPQTETFVVLLPRPVKVRYVRFRAHNYGKLPAWHQGAGGDAFIFVDEVGFK